MKLGSGNHASLTDQEADFMISNGLSLANPAASDPDPNDRQQGKAMCDKVTSIDNGVNLYRIYRRCCESTAL